MAAQNTCIDANSIAIIDRISRDLLAQLELQTQMVLILLERAPDNERGRFLAEIAELRGRIVRVRTRLLGRSAPKLVTKRDFDAS
jgi:hypothetical protein